MKNFILILCLATFSQWVYAQNKQITGRVVDTKGEAAIGASILEKGTTNGTITDFDGNFNRRSDRKPCYKSVISVIRHRKYQ